MPTFVQDTEDIAVCKRHRPQGLEHAPQGAAGPLLIEGRVHSAPGLAAAQPAPLPVSTAVSPDAQRALASKVSKSVFLPRLVIGLGFILWS